MALADIMTQTLADASALWPDVTYTPSGGEALEIPGLIRYGEDLEDGRDRASARAELWVKVSDVASPDYRDAVSADGAEWTVLRRLSGDGYVWHLELARDERPTWR